MTGITEAGDLPAGIAAAWNAGDAARFAALFAEDADFVNVVGLWWEKRRAIEKAHAYGFERIFTDARMTVERVKTRRLVPAACVVHFRWAMAGQTAPDGSPAGERRGIMSLVAERDVDGWRIVSAQNTDIIEGVDTHVVSGDGRSTASYLRANKREGEV